MLKPPVELFFTFFSGLQYCWDICEDIVKILQAISRNKKLLKSLGRFVEKIASATLTVTLQTEHFEKSTNEAFLIRCLLHIKNQFGQDYFGVLTENGTRIHLLIIFKVFPFNMKRAFAKNTKTSNPKDRFVLIHSHCLGRLVEKKY